MQVILKPIISSTTVMCNVTWCSHFGCESRRFDCILLVFVLLATRNLIKHYALLWLATGTARIEMHQSLLLKTSQSRWATAIFFHDVLLKFSPKIHDNSQKPWTPFEDTIWNIFRLLPLWDLVLNSKSMNFRVPTNFLFPSLFFFTQPRFYFPRLKIHSKIFYVLSCLDLC